MTPHSHHLPDLHQRDSLPNGELWIRIAAFLSGRAPLTRTTYGGILNEWCSFLHIVPGSAEGGEKFLSATDIHASAYRVWLEKRRGQRSRLSPRSSTDSGKALSRERARSSLLDGSQETLSNATIAKKLSALRRIYRSLISAGLKNDRNPFDVDAVRPPSSRSGMKRPTEMIDFELVEAILKLPDRSTPKGLRDAALLSVLFGGGLRRGEVAKLLVGDIKRSSKGTVYLRLRATKARRDVDHALPEWSATVVQELAAHRRGQGACDGDPLFTGFRGQGGSVGTNSAISESGIYRLFKGYCLRAGRAHGISPHSARATAITKLLTDGFSHREVQEFSRHASVQMVETYDKRRLTVEDSPGRKLTFGGLK